MEDWHAKQKLSVENERDEWHAKAIDMRKAEQDRDGWKAKAEHLERVGNTLELNQLAAEIKQGKAEERADAAEHDRDEWKARATELEVRAAEADSLLSKIRADTGVRFQPPDTMARRITSLLRDVQAGYVIQEGFNWNKRGLVSDPIEGFLGSALEAISQRNWGDATFWLGRCVQELVGILDHMRNGGGK
jgi:hypothetical protein